MSILKDIGSMVSKYLQDALKLRKLSKEDLTELIDQALEINSQVSLSISSFSAEEFKIMYSNYKDNLSNYNLKGSEKVYEDYIKKLSGRAKDFENKKMLGAINSACLTNIKLLGEFKNNINELFEQEELSIFEIKLSHVAALGLIRQAARVGTWGSFFLAQLIYVSSDDRSEIPNYRSSYLKKYVFDVAEGINTIVNTSSTYSFISDMRNLKHGQSDALLAVDNQPNQFLTTPMIVKGIGTVAILLVTVAMAGLGLAFLRWAPVKWEDFKYQNYQRNKQTKQWLEAMIAAKRLDLSGMDHEDPEYQRLVKIIESYSQMLNDIDAKIAKYTGDI